MSDTVGTFRVKLETNTKVSWGLIVLSKIAKYGGLNLIKPADDKLAMERYNRLVIVACQNGLNLHDDIDFITANSMLNQQQSYN